MKPQEWLDLTNKFIYSTTKVTEVELAQLRTNYTVWRQAVEYWLSQSKFEFTNELVSLLGVRVPPDSWAKITGGDLSEIDDSDLLQKLQDVLSSSKERYRQIRAAQATIKFLKSFDDHYQKRNGTQPVELQEVLWKSKADRLIEAIQAHRRAYVVSNKQPNGLDFALWSTIDLPDFNPSVHQAIARNGHLNFKEA